MKKETLKKIFNFLEKEENIKIPFKVKLLNNYSLTDEELIVKRDLNLTNSKITSLPKGLKVGRGLTLFGCKHIESLPEGLEVGQNLILYGTKITSLPEGLVVGGDLFLRELDIQSLPKGLKVGGSLYIKNTPLAKLSNESLRDMIGLNGYIKGDIIRS
jgi:hypothetical protein